MFPLEAFYLIPRQVTAVTAQFTEMDESHRGWTYCVGDNLSIMLPYTLTAGPVCSSLVGTDSAR